MAHISGYPARVYLVASKTSQDGGASFWKVHIHTVGSRRNVLLVQSVWYHFLYSSFRHTIQCILSAFVKDIFASFLVHKGIFLNYDQVTNACLQIFVPSKRLRVVTHWWKNYLISVCFSNLNSRATPKVGTRYLPKSSINSYVKLSECFYTDQS